MKVDITHEYRCDADDCDEMTGSRETLYFTPYGASLTGHPSAPAGWHLVNDLLFCPRHDIVLTLSVDGKLNELSRYEADRP